MVSVNGNPSPLQPSANTGKKKFSLKNPIPRKAAGTTPKKEYGFFKAVGVLWRNFRKTENLKIMTGLALRDGLPKAVDMGIMFPPVGWGVTAVGYMGPKQYAARKGAKMIENIKKSHPEGVPAALAKFDELQAIMRNPAAYHRVEPQVEQRVWTRWVNKYNEMLREAFKVDGLDAKRAASVERAVDRLSLTEDKFVGRRLRDHFLVRLEYGNKRSGRLLNFLMRNEVANRHTTGMMGKTANFMLKPLQLVRRIPVIKWPFLAAGSLIQGGMMLNISRKLKAGKLRHLV